MKHFLTGILLVVAGCGGGSGGSSVQTSASSQPAPVTNNIVIQGKVIDGYVAGATVFIDMNWSLAYEEGEPKTVTDANGNYSFNQNDLAAFPCYQSPNDGRAIIVDVPAGAVDTTRGVVPAPYRMVYLPANWLGVTQSKNGVANVTPFTSLFAAAIAEGRQQTNGGDSIIPVNQSCGQLANQIAANVKLVVADMGKVFAQAGVSLNSFYDDFIASSDNTARLKGEQIVDYLIKYKSISDLLVRDLQLEYGAAPGSFYGSYFFDADSIRSIFIGDPSTVGLDIYTVATITPPSTGKSFKFSIRLKGLRLRKDGVIITSTCQNSDPYGCPVITGTNSQALTKASTESIKTILKQEGDQLVFSKNQKNGSFTCEKNFKYFLATKPTGSNKASVTELHYEAKLPVDNKQNLYDCANDEQGFRIAKRVEFAPRPNGYYYSVFTYYAASTNSTITNNFPYAVSHFSQDVQTSVLNKVQLENEINALPVNPSSLADITAKYTGGRWFFDSGSNNERSVLSYSPELNVYSCLVFNVQTDSIVRKIEGTTDVQAVLSMCYPDLSMF